MAYANFWKRSAAYLIDSLIYGGLGAIINNVLSVFIGLALGVSTKGKEPDLGTMFLMFVITMAIQFVIWAAYYAWPESSSWQATIGKKILGLKVTDTNGQRISFGRSLWRNFAMIFSAIILGIGYLMPLWTQKKQCLHDMMSDCLVIDTTPNEKQGCVIAAVVAFFFGLVAVLIVGILAAIAMPQYFRAVEKARAAEAISIMSTVQASQRRFQLTHNRYTTNWKQLDVAPTNCQQTDGAICDANASFTVELQRNGVIAKRKNNATIQYELFMSYDPDKTPRLKCTALSKDAQSICQNLEGSLP